MRFSLAAYVLMIVAATCCLGADRGTRQGRIELTRGVDEIFAEWNAPGLPGGAVILMDGGKVILKRCYGLADIEHDISITRETRFELASVSKPFTAFAVLLLEKEGKLGLTDDIHAHLPELPDYGSPITIADLIHHTSGLSDYCRVLPYAGRLGTSGFGRDDLLRLVSRQRILEFTPGTKWSYSNTNYALLAEIVARVTCMPFGEWMRENIFEPLGMRDSSFPASGTVVLPNRANAYSRGSDGELNRSLVENFEIPGPAHAFSTIEDMAKWIENLRTGKVGGPSIIQKMQERATLKSGDTSFYGCGLGMGEYRGMRTAGHSGQTGAFKTELLYCPDIEVGVVVLGNAGWMNAEKTSRRVLDIYLGDKLGPLPEAAAETPGAQAETPAFDLDPAEYQRFLGGYRLEADPSVLVALAREGEWLVGAMVGEGLDFFRPVGQAEFENRHHNCRLTFSDGEKEKGPARRVLITLRGNEMWATRVQIPPDAPWVEECVGCYYSEELETAYRVVREPAGLAVCHRNSESRPLQPADTDVLVGGIGILTFLRDGSGRVIGFDFGEPEDFNQRQIRFARCERSL